MELNSFIFFPNQWQRALTLKYTGIFFSWIHLPPTVYQCSPQVTFKVQEQFVIISPQCRTPGPFPILLEGEVVWYGRLNPLTCSRLLALLSSGPRPSFTSLSFNWLHYVSVFRPPHFCLLFKMCSTRPTFIFFLHFCKEVL